MTRLKKKAYTWHVRGALGLAAVFVAGLFVSGAFGGVSPLGTTSGSATDTTSSAGSTVPYIVTFAQGTSGSDQTAEIAAAGATDVSAIAALSMHSIDVPAGSEQDVVAALQADANVAGVAPDRSRQTDAAPSDPGYADQWNLPMIGWDSIYGPSNPLGSSTIAVLDTGVSSAAGDLALGSGWSAFGNDSSNDPNGHGTAVASIAAATADNGIGIAGVDFASPTILPVQVLDSDGLGQDSDIIQGVVWAADHGADVILMSFSNPGFSQPLQDAVSYAWGKGAVVVAATGNDGVSTPTYPAGDAAVMGVAGTDQSDQPWTQSNTGADTFIAAPATQIPADATDGSGISITGTSASAAEVAGAAALLLANDPNATNAIVDGRLARNADPVGTTDQTGNGRLNLARALADTSTDSVTPLGAPGGGGPVVGPYKAASNADIEGTVTDAVTGNPIQGATVSCVATTNGCNSTVSTTTGTDGSYTLTVQFGGSSASTSFTVSAPGYTTIHPTVTIPKNQATVTGQNFQLTPSTQTTTTALTSSKNPSTYGDSVTFTATISPSPGGAGTVTFTDGATTLCNAVVVTGSAATCATSALAAGSHTIDAAYSGATGFGSSGDSLTQTVAKAGQTITFTSDAPTGAVVGDTYSPAATGGASGNPVTFGATGGNCSYNSGTGKVTMIHAGSCTVTADQDGNTDYDAATQATQTFAIGKANQATLTVTAPDSGTYGDHLTMTASGGTTGGTPTFAVTGDSDACSILTSGPDTGKLAIKSGSGTCKITATLAGNGDYNDVTSDPHTVSVSPAMLTVTPDAQSVTYGDDAPAYTFTVSGFVNDENETTAAGYNAPSCSSDYSHTSPVADSPRTISCDGGSADNYTLDTTATAQLTIHTRDLTITAADESKTYGETFTPDETTQFSTGATELVNDDSVTSVTLNSDGYAASALVSGSPYDITPSAAQGSGLANYSITYVPGRLTVDKRDLTVTADDQSKTYGDVFSFDGSELTTGTGQLVNGDTVDSATITSDGAAATATVSGSPYDIDISGAVGNGLANYTISYHKGSFTVDTRDLTITAADESKTYGDTFSFTGTEFTTGTGQLVNGDSVSSVTLQSDGAAATATVTSPGPTYPIHASNAVGSGLDNYSLSYTDGTLTVNKRALTITANDQTKIVGATLSLGTSAFHTNGLVNGDSVASVTLTSAGTVASATVGPYPIVPSAATGSGLDNYTIAYANGTLSVVFAPSTTACGGSFTDPSRTVLQPVDSDGTSVFKRNSTVPVKFRVCDANGNSVGPTTAFPNVVKAGPLVQGFTSVPNPYSRDSSVAGTPCGAGMSTSAAPIVCTYSHSTATLDETVISTTPDSSFRWDTTAQQWIFNLSTKNLTPGAKYTYVIPLQDSTFIFFTFAVK